MSPAHPTEKKFEDHIEQHLLKTGYQKAKPEDYDRDLCLIPTEVVAFVRDTSYVQIWCMKKN